MLELCVSKLLICVTSMGKLLELSYETMKRIYNSTNRPWIYYVLKYHEPSFIMAMIRRKFQYSTNHWSWIQLTYFLTNLENNGLIYSIRLRVYYELVQLRSAFWVNYLWRRQSSPHNAIGWFMPQQCLLKVDFRAKRLATSRRKAVPKLSKSSKGNTGGMVSDILWPSTD